MQNARQVLPDQVRKVFLENLTTLNVKFSASRLNLFTPNKLTQIKVNETTKMKQKASMTDLIHENDATVKNVKRCQPI